MKTKTIIALALSVSLIVPFSVFAATSDSSAAKNVRGFFGKNYSQLTDQQKADVADYNQKSAELQKEFINKMVANGSMTKEQGDAAIKRIDDMLTNGADKGLLPGLGMGSKGFGGRQMKGADFAAGKIDTSKLTDEQKDDLMVSYNKVFSLMKETIGKMTSNGFITEEQGERAISKIDNMSNSIKDNGFSMGMGMFMGKANNFNFFGIKGADNSSLTDQQKADFEEFSKNMESLQTEIVDKLVSYGLITSKQGENIKNRETDQDKFFNGQTKSKGMDMKRSKFKNGQMQKNPGDSAASTPTT